MIRMNLDLQIVSILNVTIYCQINEHATIQMKLIIKNNEDNLQAIEHLVGSNLSVDGYSEEDKSYSVLFNGIVKNISLSDKNTYLSVDISGISHSDEFNVNKRNRSFQKIDKTYKSIIESVVQKTLNAKTIWGVSADKILNRLVVQYQETDWEFIKRVSSQIGASLLVDETSSFPKIQIGIKKRQKREWDALKLFVYERKIIKGNSQRENCVSYSFKSQSNYNLCDWFYIEGNIFLISSKKICFDRGTLNFEYIIKNESVFHEHEQFNYRIKGISVCGTILKVEKESLYIQLDMDKESNAEFPFLWEPAYGNLVYCMPEVGEKVRVLFPSEDERDVRVIHTIRSNGGYGQNPEKSSEDFFNVQNRIFATNIGKCLKLYPQELSIENTANDSSDHSLKILDNVGICLNTIRNVELIANGNITLYSSQICGSAPQEIRFRGGASSIQINRNFNIYSPNMIENCGEAGSNSKPMILENYNGNKQWLSNYNALASIPVINIGEANFDSINMCAVASLPLISDGKAAIAMNELLGGKTMEDTTYPSAFLTMENLTMNGGYPPPNI